MLSISLKHHVKGKTRTGDISTGVLRQTALPVLVPSGLGTEFRNKNVSNKYEDTYPFSGGVLLFYPTQ